jgi:hypothetical protein
MGGMLALLSAASAFGAEFAVLGGVAAGQGFDGARFSYASWSPELGATFGWHFAFVEAWVGGASSALLAQRDLEVVSAGAFRGQAGGGFGSHWLSFGGYLGAGVPEREAGLYGRFDLPARKAGAARAVGAELRLSYIPSLDMGVGSAYLRVELGRDRRKERREQAVESPVYHPDPYEP